MARRPRNIDEAQSARLLSRVIAAGLTIPPGYDLLVTDSRCGRHRRSTQTCTVPLWATKADFTGTANADFELYYAAHELAHAWVYVNGTRDCGPHGPKFYEQFKRLCPPALWHHELGYKTREAKRAGISPNPMDNKLTALPDAPAAVRATVDTYVAATDNELRRAAIKRDPRIEKKLAATPDRDVKSFIRGWFNPTFNN